MLYSITSTFLIFPTSFFKAFLDKENSIIIYAYKKCTCPYTCKTSLMNKVKVEAKRGHTTSVLTLKWRAWCNIWLISWILCINGQRDTLGQDWRLPLTATVNFQHNQFMCSSIITICVQQSRQRI